MWPAGLGVAAHALRPLCIILLLPRDAWAAWSELPEILPIQEGSLETLNIGLPGEGHVVALGHFSPQRRLDCVVLDETRTQLFIFLMDNPKDGHFYKAETVAVAPKGREIVNVVMSDFDHDGFADILMMHKSKAAKDGDDTIALSLYLGNGETLRESPLEWKRLPTFRGQPMPLDWSGTMQLDLLGARADGKPGQLGLWKAQARSRDEINSGYDGPLALDRFGRLAQPHWSAQADFNGDGLSDLLLMTCKEGTGPADSLEIWLRRGSTSSNPRPSLDPGPGLGPIPIPIPYDDKPVTKRLPWGAGPLLVTDVDGDGHLDIVFSVCHPADTCAEENSLHIMYNIQRRFCSSHRKDADCMSAERLFSPNKFDFDERPDSDTHMVLPLASIFKDEDVRIMSMDPYSGDPVSLAVGDFDLDSYPDLAVVVGPRKRPTDPKLSRVALLRNIPCSQSVHPCSPAQIKDERRSFAEIRGAQVKALRDIRGVVSVGFADWYGIGPPDFIVNRYDEETKKPKHVPIKNGIAGDAFSVRVEALNGVCPSPCRRVDSLATAERPYGVNFIGPSFRLSFVDSFGATQIRSETQLGQVLNCALQSSTSLVGLGSTSNFVQRLDVGVFLSHAEADEKHSITNVIPNSEVIFVPPHADSPAWRAELQINPGDYILYVLVSVASALLVLAILTGIFKWQEKREDDEERRKATHLVNFDAL